MMCFRSAVRISFIIVILLLLATAGSSGQSFQSFRRAIDTFPDSASREEAVIAFLKGRPVPVVTESTVTFLYEGTGSVVAVACEMNGWSPSSGLMAHIPGTALFYRTETLPSDARMEYKIWVDSVWMLDPRNPLVARGGFGDNSELRMPLYTVPSLPRPPKIPEGSIDTFLVTSAILKCSHTLFLYTPAIGHAKTGQSVSYPLLIVTDGEEYLRFTRLNHILDTLIAAGDMRPVYALFVDPKTDLANPSSNRRMAEYAASRAFLDFIETEAIPMVAGKCNFDRANRVILGASMGGLIATFATLTRPDVFPACAAQSPAFIQADSAVFHILDTMQIARGEFAIQTGTLRDTEKEARAIGRILEKKQGNVHFGEFHEGHNWTNWRTHLPGLLRHFFHR
jgi:enterochelin esterase-like enzyme